MEENKITLSGGSAAPEEKKSGQWVEKLRYSKSFVAKLSLSEPKVKEYYAALATRLLSYDRVRSRMSWSGVTFQTGRSQMARFVINGKTLCLYLALSPKEYGEGKYRTLDASEKKKYEKTPALLKIRSEGALRHALSLIDQLAASFELRERPGGISPILPRYFPADSFGNLMTRGLIRLLKTGKPGVAGTEAPEEDNAAEEPSWDLPDLAGGAYEDTVSFAESLFSRYGIYGEILRALSGGEASAKLSRRLMLRSVDEIWVRAVEDALPALDELIRNPTHFIEEREEVMPVELTKKITSRSVQYLSQHTDMISKVEGDTVTPTKMLNVFREDSVLTYENKFLNTLLHRLYSFVTRRYEIGQKNGADERVTELSFSDRFNHDGMTGQVKLSVSLSEKCREKPEEKNTVHGTGLWHRVEKLNGIVTAYLSSDFVAEMGKNYVKPPVMRTNAILKNKYFRQCLALWEFIESYDDSGYGLIVNERLEDLPQDYIRQIYGGAAMQYLLFRHHIRGDYNSETAIAEYVSEMLNPHIVNEIEAPAAEDFDEIIQDKEEAGENDILFALRVALEADKCYRSEEEEEAEESALEAKDSAFAGIRYRKSFLARLILADESLKARFTEIANTILSYKKAKMRLSFSYASFNVGRTQFAKAVIKGKTLCLYLALDPAVQDPKYFLRDVSATRRYARVPALLRVRSDRGLRYAVELIAKEAGIFALVPRRVPDTPLTPADYPADTFESLLARGLIRPLGGETTGSAVQEVLPAARADMSAESPKTMGESAENEAAEVPEIPPEAPITEPETADHATAFVENAEEINAQKTGFDPLEMRYRKSFTAKLITAEPAVKRYFTEVANAFLSYRRVHLRQSWHYAAFKEGRSPLARTVVKGKSLYLYLALPPEEQHPKYFLRDVSGEKRFAEVPALLKIRTERGLKYARELISGLAESRGLLPAKSPLVLTVEDFASMTDEELLQRGLMKAVGGGQEVLTPQTGEETEDISAALPLPQPEESQKAPPVRESEIPAVKTAPPTGEPPMTVAETKEPVGVAYGIGSPEETESPLALGVDDSRGFMADAAENEKEEGEVETRRGFFAKFFGFLRGGRK